MNGEESLHHLRRAVAIDPDRERVYTTLVRFCRQRGDWRRKVIHLRKPLLCEPEQLALLNRLAYILSAHPEERECRGEERLAEYWEGRTHRDFKLCGGGKGE